MGCARRSAKPNKPAKTKKKKKTPLDDAFDALSSEICELWDAFAYLLDILSESNAADQYTRMGGHVNLPPPPAHPRR